MPEQSPTIGRTKFLALKRAHYNWESHSEQLQRRAKSKRDGDGRGWVKWIDKYPKKGLFSVSLGLCSTSCTDRDTETDTLTASPAARSPSQSADQDFLESLLLWKFPRYSVFLPGSSKENALRCSLAEAPGPWTPPAEALTAAMARFIHGSPTAIALVYVETREGGSTFKQAFDVLQHHRISKKVHLLFDILNIYYNVC